MTPENEMKPDAFLCGFCHSPTTRGEFCPRCICNGTMAVNLTPLYALTHPRIQALVDAAKLAVLNFRRKDLADVEFLGDDDHEAWSALTAALAPFTHESSERKEGGK